MGKHPEPIGGRMKLETFHACIRVYNAFVMGGNVWSAKRFPVTGYAVRFGEPERDGFVWLLDGKQQLHDKKTGFFLCEGEDIPSAVRKATLLVRITPDFVKQAEELGDAENQPLIPYDEALRLLELNKDGRRANEKELDRLIRKELKNASRNDPGRSEGRAKKARRVAPKDRKRH